MAEETNKEPHLPTDDVSIVVVGGMNPRIHHPLWYKMQNLISEAECAAAIAGPLVLAPDYAQFQFGEIRISCNLGRWDIRTTELANRGRILDISKTMFDTALPQTPVGLFAFNNDALRKTAVSDVSKVLGERAEQLGFAFPRRPDGASYKLTFAGTDGGPIHVSIDTPADFPGYVAIRVNSNHPIDLSKKPPGIFNMGPMMSEHFEPDHATAKSFADGVVRAINKSEGR